MNKTPRLGNISPLIPAGRDLEKTLSFYEQKLGFSVFHKEGNPTRMAIVRRDSAEIFLCQNEYVNLSGQISIRIRVDNIDRLYFEYLARNIVSPDGKLETKPWGPREFVVLAPEGVCITFYDFSN